MLTRKAQNSLDTMMQDPNFRVTGKGDTFFATAPGHRAKRVMFRGDVTPAGQWMRDQRGLHLSADGVDTTARTEFRGNSEWATTMAGKRVRLRGPQGLTARGHQVYQRPEITVHVPATQEGTNKVGDTYEIETTKVYTENEFPEMGELFRSGANEQEGMKRVVDFFKAQFEDNDFMHEESAQVWQNCASVTVKA